MRQGHRRVLLVGWLWLGSVGGAAFGQAAPGVNAEATQWFERGVAQLRQGLAGEAVVAFERSLALREAPSTVFNLALALRGAGRYVDATRAIGRYLRHPSPSADAQELAQLEAELGRLRASTARVDVRAEPGAATVRVDGADAQPVEGVVLLDPGRHALELTAEGFRPERRELTLEAGDVFVWQARLVRVSTTGRLELTVAGQPRAVALLDGRSQGTLPLRAELGEGEHVVEVQAPGALPWRRVVRIEAGALARFDVTLTPRGVSPWVPVLAVLGAAAVAAAVSVPLAVYFRTPLDAVPTPGGNFVEGSPR